MPHEFYAGENPYTDSQQYTAPVQQQPSATDQDQPGAGNNGGASASFDESLIEPALFNLQ